MVDMNNTRTGASALHFRPLVAHDIDRVPLSCQGTREEVAARIEDLGASALLAFDGEQHVAQLQFRRYDPALRSQNGIWDPRYWGDFGDDAPALPRDTLAIFCFHVGQLDASEARDARYQQRGIATALLDALVSYARERGFAAIIAKHTPPLPAVMGFMGGLSTARYAQRGFRRLDSWVDEELRAAVLERGLVRDDEDANQAATVGCCVLDLRQTPAR